jgi:ParB-like chromosome segregation protein Spo0J
MAQPHPRSRMGAERKPCPRLSITYRGVDELETNPQNPRHHSTKQIQQIARSIEAFGLNVPFLTGRDGRLIAGHGGLAACRMLGIRQVPTVSLEHLSEAQARAFMIADNRLAENSTWNRRLLSEQLKSLSHVNLDFSLETSGFEIGEIELMIAGLTPATVIKEDAGSPGFSARRSVAARQPLTDLWRCIGRAELFITAKGDHAAAVFTSPRCKDLLGRHDAARSLLPLL